MSKSPELVPSNPKNQEAAAGWDDGRFRTDLEATLAAFLDDQASWLGHLGADVDRILAQARQSVSGGKRLRAAFCWWGYQSVVPPQDDTEATALLRAAGSLELLHASALVHDDLMDASDTRRGRPAVHRWFEGFHRTSGWASDPTQYGAAGAILLGDLLLSWADELLRTSGFPPERVLSALSYFDLTRSEVVVGQFLDVSVQARGEADLDTAMRVLRYKSAKYSIERPLHVGAALAGGSPELIDALSAIGLPLGEAFQLRDDLLGVFGDPEVTGKPAGDDLTEGKRTVLVAMARDGLSAADWTQLDGALGTDLDAASIDALRALIEQSGARDQVEHLISTLTERALDALSAAPITDTARVALTALADAATQRTV